jgi:hypothetical protein
VPWLTARAAIRSENLDHMPDLDSSDWFPKGTGERKEEKIEKNTPANGRRRVSGSTTSTATIAGTGSRARDVSVCQSRQRPVPTEMARGWGRCPRRATTMTMGGCVRAAISNAPGLGDAMNAGETFVKTAYTLIAIIVRKQFAKIVTVAAMSPCLTIPLFPCEPNICPILRSIEMQEGELNFL